MGIFAFKRMREQRGCQSGSLCSFKKKENQSKTKWQSQ